MSQLSRNQLKTYFETGDIPTEQEFGDTIDSFISKTEDGITSIPLTTTPGAKAIGINVLKPASPLSVQAMNSGDAIAIRASSNWKKFDPEAEVDKAVTIWHQMVNPFVPNLKTVTSASAAAELAVVKDLSAAAALSAKMSTAASATTDKFAVDPLPVSGAAVLGYAIARETKAGLDALMIIDETGQMGIGKLVPAAKLHLSALTQNDSMGIILENAATKGFWKIGHLSDNSTSQRDSALKICNNEDGIYNERLIMLRNGYVGLGGAKIPDTTLQVHVNTGDTNARVDLRANTGSVVIGPITDNLTLDFEGLQARESNLVGNTNVLEFTPKDLEIQPVGGGVVFHSRVAPTTPPTPSTVVKIDETGNLGIGTASPEVRLHVNGTMKLEEATSPTTPTDGMIRWDGDDVLLYKQGAWNPIAGAGGSNQWQDVANTAQIYYSPTGNTATGVGIGVTTPTAMLHVSNSKPSSSVDSTSVLIQNSSTLSGGTSSDRIGLQITNTGPWSTATSVDPHDVALFVTSASGIPSKHYTAAAVLNGNVVIGADTLNGALTGTNGSNVLVLKEGSVPSTKVGTSGTNGGIQICAAQRVTSAANVTPVTSVSTFQVINGDGTVYRLFRQPSMTPNVAIPSLVDTDVKTVLTNMRTRIDQLEAILKNLGILPPTNPNYDINSEVLSGPKGFA